MSRTRLVKGKIFDFAEKFSYHSESSIIESSTVFYEEKSETVILHGGNPENPPSADLVDYYVKIRIKDPANYKGEFGFDWIDIDPVSEEIQKIQDVGFSDVEYFYKKGATVNDLGDIIAKSADESGAKTAIKESYKFPDSLKPCTDGRIDRPFVLIKLNQEISLSLEVNIPKGGTLADEKIYLTDDEFYSFEMIGGTKDPATKRTEIKVSSDKQVVELKIKCLKESSSEKKYTILQESPMKKGNPVGGFFMMENKVLKLKFRVIALVSSDGSPATKAQALFQKFKDNDVKKYLNENSLNQAGYEVEIENQAMFDTLGSGDLDDYFYAFDKTDWTNKKYYNTEKRQKYKLDANGYGSKKPDGSWEMEENNAEVLFKDIEKDSGEKDDQGRPIMDTISIDDIAIDGYNNKLKKKSKSYTGGLIILSDGEAMDPDLAAFSRTTPFNYYALFVYTKTNYKNDLFAHEIGHMLGLNHVFYSTDEGFEKVWKGLNDIKKSITDAKTETGKFNIKKITTTRKKIILALNNAIANLSAEITKRNGNYIQAQKANGTFTWSNKSVSKSVFLEKSKAVIDDLGMQKKSNVDALKEFQSKKENVYIDFTKKDSSYYHLLVADYLIIQEDYLKYYAKFLAENYVIYKQGSTKNMMDYHNTRIFFQHHQILTMRKDYENY